jgi:hypothetical protein
VPNFTKSEREQNLVYPDMIKAVLHEEWFLFSFRCRKNCFTRRN